MNGLSFAVTVRPENIEACTALNQCMIALKEMAVIWPSASRAWDLLSGVQLRTHVNPLVSLVPHRYPDRHKRMAEDAFGEQGADYSRQQPQAVPSGSTANNNASGVHEIGHRLMAHMLGLEAPGADPSGYYLLLQSRPPFVPEQTSNQQLSYPSSAGFTQTMNPAVMSPDGSGSGGNWAQNMAAPDSYGMNNSNGMWDFGGYGV